MPDQDPNVPAPIPPLHGQNAVRGSHRVSLSSINEGRFGRMFRRLSPMPPLEEAQLQQIADQMVDEDTPSGWGGTPEPRDNPHIPSGYTYFGQFVDHDITFDPVSSSQRIVDPDALHNFRSPRLDLDSVYGSGPADEPFQYVRNSHGMELLVEPNQNKIEDLPRNSQDVALIGDPRNDENTIVGQLHLLFLKLHNKVAAQVASEDTVPIPAKFEEAQRRVRWLYQWVVVHDFVPKIIGDEMFDRLTTLNDDGTLKEVHTRYYRAKNNAYMPVEFSGAAYRFGHSMIRGIYNLSSSVTDRPIFIPGPLPDELADLRGFRRLPAGWTVDWELFFPLGSTTPQPSRLIDSKLVRGLFTLPGGGNLAFLNLLKGQILKLPSGQDVAKLMQVQVLSGSELGVVEPTPLWFYILKEAELVADGRHLGPVGGRIVGEVLLGLVELDKQSWLSVNPGWRPVEISGMADIDGDGVIGVPDLVAFAEGTA